MRPTASFTLPCSSVRKRRLANAGFTVVELAIVLAIIGLVIGGVLAGRSLIAASEVNSVISDTNKYRAATATFRNKYLALPGDFSSATKFWGDTGACPGNNGTNTGTCNGNGDGNVPWANWLAYNDATISASASNEMYRFWQHLSLAGVLGGQYTGVTNSTSSIGDTVVPGKNMPGTRLSGFFAMYAFLPNGSTQLKHWLLFYGIDPTVGPVNPEQAASIDRKADDGLPGTGSVQTNVPAGYPNCVTTNDPVTAQYNISNTSYPYCGLWFTLE